MDDKLIPTLVLPGDEEEAQQAAAKAEAPVQEAAQPVQAAAAAVQTAPGKSAVEPGLPSIHRFRNSTMACTA